MKLEYADNLIFYWVHEDEKLNRRIKSSTLLWINSTITPSVNKYDPDLLKLSELALRSAQILKMEAQFAKSYRELEIGQQII